jgi:hypothetical protein
MWVSVVPGFDPNGLQVTKWRESFQRHGVLVGQWTQGEEEVKELRRRCLVSRLVADGVDVLPPLVDAVVRVSRGTAINVSGISRHNILSEVWTAAAWRMEVISLTRPEPDP